jgi:hypothetical protein
MKTKITYAALALCALLVLLGFTYRQSAPRWEYKIDSPRITEDKLDANYLSALGSDGWELVSVERDGRSRTYFFKRPK